MYFLDWNAGCCRILALTIDYCSHSFSTVLLVDMLMPLQDMLPYNFILRVEYDDVV